MFKNPDFGSHTQPPILHRDHFYAQYTTNERSDGLVAMSLDGQVTWKTDRQPPFVRGGAILADTDGNTTLYLIERDPAGFKPLASALVRNVSRLRRGVEALDRRSIRSSRVRRI